MRAENADFDELLVEVMAGRNRFGHREHVHVTWLAVRRFGRARALELITDGIRRTARYVGAPQKYHATITRAWVELVAYHVQDVPFERFDDFAAHHAALLDKRLLTRFYEPATLAGSAARTGWIAPDRAPFPWAA